MPNQELPVSLFKTQKAWEAWLRKNAASAAGVWVRMAKKNADLKSINHQETLEVALCYGWIDGQARSYDENSWLQKFGPRGPRSIWSKINREKVLALIKSKRMQPAGLAAIERARANGQWEAAYDSPKNALPPLDLQKALNANPKAKAFFATLKGQNRYAVLFRIQTAKKAETRQRRIDKFVAMLAKKETLH